ncbi:pyrophosphatase [Xanthomonas sp. SHU 199]|uniref:pyrophosphatase n=1 Tax=Xanthomonas sp. SHU 199 TaxID=1591174 RepID=UPI0018E3D4D9|nr:pyrophosphatase [Xanthomonas sp. SHU 199]
MQIRIYSEEIRETDFLPDQGKLFLGLFGEVGSVLTTAKKQSRESMTYDYKTAIMEELGDVAWYFFRLCDNWFVDVDKLLNNMGENPSSILVATSAPSHPLASASEVRIDSFEESLSNLGLAVTEVLLARTSGAEAVGKALHAFFARYLAVVSATQVPLDQILSVNLKKVRGRYILPKLEEIDSFDSSFGEDEQLPLFFEIHVVERKNGKTYLKWNGVFIGDPLTDNIAEEDGYRFHDVFHMAFASILGWSPTFRALLRRKRKSDPLVDEEQDSGRAIVIEEGLSAWIFSAAKHLDYFEGRDRVPFDLLKGISTFVEGYEVDVLPLSLWEKAILDGYAVFRQLRNKRQGVIVGRRDNRSIEFRATP